MQKRALHADSIVVLAIRWLQRLVANPGLLTLVIVIDVGSYFGGLLYWYGYVMADAAIPVWAWPFIPDCPLFGLLGGLGLLMVIAHRWWTDSAQARMQRSLWGVAIVSLALWLSTYAPGMPSQWVRQSAMLGVWSGVILLGALLFRRSPSWFLGILAFGQIKYGIWTVTAWILFWRNTAAVYGSPLYTFDSVFMTITHIGLIAQGVFLLTFFRPTVTAAIAGFVWFGLSDFMDYGLGFYPPIPEQFIPLPIMQWSTIAVTVLLTAIFLVAGMGDWRKARVESRDERPATQTI